MATEPASGAGRWGAYAFAAVAAAFLVRMWALQYAGLNLDECSFIVQAGLVASGTRLYGGTLCQHMPFDVMAIHPLAALGLLKDPAPYRLLVATAQASAALLLALSPVFKEKRVWGWGAGIGYLLIYAGLATLLKGHVYSGYALAGAAWVVSFSLLGLPLVLGQVPSRAQAFVGGAAYAVWALSSPALGIASIFYLAACAFAPGLRGKTTTCGFAWGASRSAACTSLSIACDRPNAS